MSVLAVVTKPEEALCVITWGARFAWARDAELTILSWQFATPLEGEGVAAPEDAVVDDSLLAAVQAATTDVGEEFSADGSPDGAAAWWNNAIAERQAQGAELSSSVLELIRTINAELVVASSGDPTGRSGATYATNPLLQQSPCNTVILCNDMIRRGQSRNVFVATTASVHDRVAVSLADRLVRRCNAQATITAHEEDCGEADIEVSLRELRELMHDADVAQHDAIEPRVFVGDTALADLSTTADAHDLVLTAANNATMVQGLLATTTNTAVAVIKRAPPLRVWRRTSRVEWIPRLNAADYADLVQGLRRGSRFGYDFMIMLGAAAAITTLGLLQNSPAVVIGSMLLAPLMTPMVGSGLALAQANRRLASSCFRSISWGFLMTLVISFVVALVTHGEEMTTEILARGDPNLLDLGIALFSAVAASFALARPSLVGSVAGVAIATALVPPLCATGISLAYGHLLNGMGAALLFVTNLVAIILAAAITFRVMGVTAARATSRQRRWVIQVVGSLALAVVVLAVPLERALEKQIEEGRPQPLGYPLTGDVVTALLERTAEDEGVEIIFAARTARLESIYDVLVYVASRERLPRSYRDELAEIVRKEMDDQQLSVGVFSLLQGWEEKGEAVDLDVNAKEP